MFYAGFTVADLPWLGRAALILALSGWIAVQFYTGPLLLESPRKRLLPALLTALLLALAEPVYTPLLAWIAAVPVLAATEIAPPLAVLGAGFVALVGNLAVIERLATFGRTPDSRSARLYWTTSPGLAGRLSCIDISRLVTGRGQAHSVTDRSIYCPSRQTRSVTVSPGSVRVSR